MSFEVFRASVHPLLKPSQRDRNTLEVKHTHTDLRTHAAHATTISVIYFSVITHPEPLFLIISTFSCFLGLFTYDVTDLG